MRIEPITNMNPKMERPVTTGAADPVAVDRQLLSNDPEVPVAAVQETAKSVPVSSNGRSETVWLQKEKRSVYRIVDSKSGDVITQMPSQEVLKVSESISELLQEDSPKQLDVES